MSSIDIQSIAKDRWMAIGFSLAIAACLYSVAFFFLRFDADLPNQTTGYTSAQGFETGRSSSLYFIPLASLVFTIANLTISSMLYKIDKQMSRVISLSSIAVMLTIVAVIERILE